MAAGIDVKYENTENDERKNDLVLELGEENMGQPGGDEPLFCHLMHYVRSLNGSLCGCGNLFHTWFNWTAYVNLAAAGSILITIWGYNLYESIIVSQTALTAL